MSGITYERACIARLVPMRQFRSMRKSGIAPYLTTAMGKKCCSACGQVFPKGVKPSLSRAFAEHVRKVHKPKRKDE